MGRWTGILPPAGSQCHQNGVTGAPSQFTELRAGHLDENGNFVNPTVVINDGAASITGRSILNDRAICDMAQEHVPETETTRARRAVFNTLSDGFVETVPDVTFLQIAADQSKQTDGRIHGEAITIPILEAPGQMGVANRLRPKDVSSVCKVTDLENV